MNAYSESTEVLQGKIRKDVSTAIAGNTKVIASAINYTYYAYGNGWAKYLGGASGEAPSFSCNIEYNIYNLNFLPKK